MAGCSRKMKVRKGNIFSGVGLWIISFGPTEGTFKKDLNKNMENSFSLGGESHQYRQNSALWWQHKEEETTGKPWEMRGFRLHPQAQARWALLPVTLANWHFASSEPGTPHKQPDTQDTEIQTLCTQFCPEAVYLVLLRGNLVIFWQGTIFKPSLCCLGPSALIFRWGPLGLDRCRVNTWPRCTI